MAGAALSLKGFAGEVFGLLTQDGVARHVFRVAVVGALGVVVGEAVGQGGAGLAVLGAGGLVAGMGGDSLVVVAGKGGATALDAASGGPVVEAVGTFNAVGAVEANAVGVGVTDGERAVVVEEDEAVLGDVLVAVVCFVRFVRVVRRRRR